MAKFAPVCPARIYKGLQASDSSLIDYVLLLAHDVHANKALYREVFDSERLRPFESAVIMDNSVIELGTAVTLDWYKEAVETVGADVVVLPDDLEKSRESAALTIKAYREGWGDAFEERDFMIVPQGETFNDWVSCLETILEANVRAEWIGIPRNTTGRIVESRQRLVETALLFSPGSKIHLLGFSNCVTDDILTALHPGVTGIDSAVPLRWASKGERNWFGRDPGPRGDWFETCQYTELMATNVQEIIDLIDMQD